MSTLKTPYIKPIHFLIISILSLAGIISVSCDKIAAGSYPYAEHYEMDISEELLITAIKNFKKHHPEFTSPDAITIKGNPSSLKEGRDGTDDFWYHLYFYYPDSNQIIYTWSRPINNSRTTFALVGINQGLELGNWKLINHDLKGEENRHQKEKFEQLIIKGIKKELSSLK